MSHLTLSGYFLYFGLGPFLAVFATPCLAQGNEIAQIETPRSAKPPVQDIFAVRTWAPPVQAEPESVKVEKPRQPQVPQLPFRFIGKIADPDQPMTFLLGKGNRIHSISVGDVIEGVYLVEKYERAHLYFIYKPMKARQSLFVGSAS